MNNYELMMLFYAHQAANPGVNLTEAARFDAIFKDQQVALAIAENLNRETLLPDAAAKARANAMLGARKG